APLGVGAPGDALAGPEQQRLRELRRMVAAPDEDPPAARRIPAIEAGRRAAQRLDGAVGDQVDHLVELEGGRQLAGHVEQDRGIALALTRLPVEARVVDRGGELLTEELEVGDPAPGEGARARLFFGRA